MTNLKSLLAHNTGMEHHILTQGQPFTAEFCHPHVKKLVAAKTEFLQLEKEGNFRRSASSSAPPFVSSPQAKKVMAAVRHYRRLNIVTELDVYPLPDMMDFTTRMARCTGIQKIPHRDSIWPLLIPETYSWDCGMQEILFDGRCIDHWRHGQHL